MFAFIAVVAAVCYLTSGYYTFNGLMAPVLPGRVTLGVSGMILFGFILGSALDNLLP